MGKTLLLSVVETSTCGDATIRSGLREVAFRDYLMAPVAVIGDGEMAAPFVEGLPVLRPSRQGFELVGVGPETQLKAAILRRGPLPSANRMSLPWSPKGSLKITV